MDCLNRFQLGLIPNQSLQSGPYFIKVLFFTRSSVVCLFPLSSFRASLGILWRKIQTVCSLKLVYILEMHAEHEFKNLNADQRFVLKHP